jgi:hypothetical protein
VGLLAIVLSPWVGKNVSRIDPRKLATVAFVGFGLVLWMRSRFNTLADFDTIEQVNAALKAAGFVLNTVGGEVKGDPEVMLEQSSTMADKAEVAFSDGVRAIPSCFYEFALRYPQADGVLYPGFVEASADKIFESTNAM